MEKSPSINNNINQIRSDIRASNREDMLRMREESSEIRREIENGSLSEAALKELRARQSELVRGEALLRDSITALSTSDALFVTAPSPIEFTITDESSLLYNTHIESLNELESLRIERDNLFDIISGERLQSALKDIDKRILDAQMVEQKTRIAYERSLDKKTSDN